MAREHHYEVQMSWTGNTGSGTADYRAYSRDHEVTAQGPGVLQASADPAFRGDAGRWNPEQLLLASASQCHMLWYLHLASTRRIVVTGYEDRPTAVMTESAGGGGEFTSILLRPQVTISAGDPEVADALHHEVGKYCFIARSLSVPITHEPQTVVEPG